MREAVRSGRSRIWYVLLLVPFVALLWVPFYARETPRIFGIPFFYWYQFAWVPVTALLTLFVYLVTRPPIDDRRGRGEGEIGP